MAIDNILNLEHDRFPIVRRPAGAAGIITGLPFAWREEFHDAGLGDWIDLSVAPYSINVASSELGLAVGSASPGDARLRSKVSFSPPVMVTFGGGLSAALLDQRVANQEIYLSIVNAAGDSMAAWMFDGTTATSAKIVTVNGGYSQQIAKTILTTASPYIYEIELRTDEVRFHQRYLNNNSGRVYSYALQSLLPNPDDRYFIEIRMKNTGVTSGWTTLTLGHVILEDFSYLPVEVISGRMGALGTGQLRSNNVPVVLSDVDSASVPSDALTAPYALKAQAVSLLFTGAAYERRRTPNIIRSGTFTASGNTALWTPNTGKKFRLMRYCINVPGNAYLGSAGVLDMKFQDASADFLTGGVNASPLHAIYLPAAAGTNFGGWTTGWVTLDNGYLSQAANNVLNFNLSAAMTNGAYVTVVGTEE
jgi:hypothetical protein